jgi:hypothetical protein
LLAFFLSFSVFLSLELEQSKLLLSLTDFLRRKEQSIKVMRKHNAATDTATGTYGRGGGSVGGRRAEIQINVPQPQPLPLPQSERRGASGKRHRRHSSWLVPLMVAANVVLFLISMYVNDCPKNSSRCYATFLGRFSFQPTKENPLLGPSSST